MIIHNAGFPPIDTEDEDALRLFTVDGVMVQAHAGNLASAYALAVGHPPALEMLSDGKLVPIYTQVDTHTETKGMEGTAGTGPGTTNTTQFTIGYQWVSDDGLNTAIAVEYAAEVDAWNKHAAVCKSAVDLWLARQKGKK